MRHYELLFIVKPTLTEEEVVGKLNFVKEVLNKNGAEIVAVDEMGVRKLAYDIDKNARGYYYVLYFKAEPSIIDEVLRNLRLTEEIIRFLNVKFEKKKEIENWEKLVANVNKKSAKKEEAPVAQKEEETPAKEETKEEAPVAEEEKVEAPVTQETPSEEKSE
jgi:small subunit ribosomal protein S6